MHFFAMGSYTATQLGEMLACLVSPLKRDKAHPFLVRVSAHTYPQTKGNMMKKTERRKTSAKPSSLLQLKVTFFFLPKLGSGKDVI